MKYLRMLVVVLFVLAAGGYAFLYVKETKNADTTAPVFTCGEDLVTVSVKDPEDALIQGITASDDRDGDVTGSIVVENLGPFLSDGSRLVNYVVCDSSYNTAHFSRSMKYSDYTSPRFALSRTLRFVEGDHVDLIQYLSASDLLDGDLTRQIQLVNGYFSKEPAAGKYNLTFHVANSAGDTSYINLLVDVSSSDDSSYTPYVNLSDYIIYLKKGKAFNPYQYIEDVTISNRTFPMIQSSDEESAREGQKCMGLFGNMSNKTPEDDLISSVAFGDIYIDNQVDRNTPGVYTVTYMITTQDGYTGTTGLSVIVYE